MPNTQTETTANFHSTLKAETAALHEGLEALPLSQALLSPQLSLAQYGDYLSRMHGFVSYIESKVFPVVADTVTDSGFRHKKQLLENDLRCLGFDIPGTEMPAGTDVPGKAYAIGMVYVLEGSTLGGRYILKNIINTLALSPERGASYCNGYGQSTGMMWKNFMSMLTQYETEHGNPEEIIAGANYAFALIRNQLTTAS